MKPHPAFFRKAFSLKLNIFVLSTHRANLPVGKLNIWNNGVSNHFSTLTAQINKSSWSWNTWELKRNFKKKSRAKQKQNKNKNNNSKNTWRRAEYEVARELRRTADTDWSQTKQLQDPVKLNCKPGGAMSGDCFGLTVDCRFQETGAWGIRGGGTWREQGCSSAFPNRTRWMSHFWRKNPCRQGRFDGQNPETASMRRQSLH